MTGKAIYSGLNQLGAASTLPASPEDAVLERVENPHLGTDYVVRFTAPEFTSLCPVTGQPDFAFLMIDTSRPVGWWRASRSSSTWAASATTVPFTRDAPSTSLSAWKTCWHPNGPGSAAIGTRAAACRSTCSTSPVSRPKMSGFRRKTCPRTVDGHKREANERQYFKYLLQSFH